MSVLCNSMQYPVTTDGGSLYPTPPPNNGGLPVAENYGDYTFYDGGGWVTGDTKIKIGGYAGQTNQGANSVALGYFAGTTNQGEEAVAIGHNSANVSQGIQSVAVGYNTAHGSTGGYAVAIGGHAGYDGQKTGAVAIGSFAGGFNQNSFSIAFGANAGYNDQASNTIILNATGSAMNGVAGQGDSFYVAPIRDYANANTFSPLGYNPTSKEIGYALPRCGIHNCVGTTQVITITGLTTGGVVGLTYFGGAGQSFASSVATANTLTVELGQTAAIGDSIVWIVGKL